MAPFFSIASANIKEKFLFQNILISFLKNLNHQKSLLVLAF
jgi:hypothetical protein